MPAETLTTVPSPGPATFRLDAASLGAAVDACQAFVPRRPFRPILSTMLLRAEDGRVHLSATDLEDAISVAVDGTGEGALCLPPAVRASLPKAGAVEVAAEGGKVRSGRLALQSFDATEYPVLPERGGAEGQPVPSAEFLRILTRAATCAAKEENGRALLRAVAATERGEVLATDGFHVLVHEQAGATGAVLGAMEGKVPATFIAKLNKPAVRRGACLRRCT